MSALLYYVAIVVSTFIVPLADVEYISWSEIYKYVGVSIVVGHYCSHMTGLMVFEFLPLLVMEHQSTERCSKCIHVEQERKKCTRQ